MILKATDFFDLPRVLDASVTTIPKSSSLPVQIIAKTKQQAVGIRYTDNTGKLIGVYIGPVGHEKLVCIIGNGDTGHGFGIFPAGARVSIGNLENTDITAGTLTGHLVAT